MPWKAADALKHVKGLSPKQQRAWAHVANNVLDKCQADGGANCDASAIKQANAVVKRMSESDGSLAEAATIKAKAQAFLRGADALLADKTLPGDLREKITALRGSLKKRWADLETDAAAATPAKAARATEAATTDPERTAQLVAELEEALLQADSLDTTRQLVQSALRQRFTADPYDYGYRGYAWIRDLYPDQVVYDQDGRIWQCDYTIDRSGDSPAAVLGEPLEVLVAYVPADEVPSDPTAAVESQTDLAGDVVPLDEKALRRDGTVLLKLIQPGWGSSGYYPADVLERDGPKVFTKGTKAYWDHPTLTEDAERPERSLRDLAAELTSDARWDANGAAGAGLYADAKVFSAYQESVEDLAPHIGVSIRALGKAADGEAEGRAGKVIRELVAAKSTDFVTVPGAGGQVVQLFEAARGRAHPQGQQGGTDVTDEEARQLREANTAMGQRLSTAETELARLREVNLLREARDIVTATLVASTLPDVTRARLVEQQSANPPVKDGALDREALVTRVTEAAKAEAEYLAQAAGAAGLGVIRGMGAGGEAVHTAEESAGLLERSFRDLGLSESGAKIATAGRV